MKTYHNIHVGNYKHPDVKILRNTMSVLWNVTMNSEAVGGGYFAKRCS